jgi:hypothetical protein
MTGTSPSSSLLEARGDVKMDVKEAVAAAKKFIAELFAQENITRLGLEEVEFDEQEGEWRVTVGFSRPWDAAASALLSITQQANPPRSYKVVRISDSTGAALSVKNREGVS